MITTIILYTALSLEIEPKLLSAICWVESNHRNVINPKDGKTPSYGPCQIKLETANWMRLKHHISEVDLTEKDIMIPQISIFYAALYLKYQLKRYKNNPKCSISAYNAGRCISSNKDYIKKVKNRQLKLQNRSGI